MAEKTKEERVIVHHVAMSSLLSCYHSRVPCCATPPPLIENLADIIYAASMLNGQRFA